MNLSSLGPALVLRKFTVSTQPMKPEHPIVEIEARKGGLLSWILTILGIDNITRLLISRREVSFKAGSLFGEITSMIPMTAVASAHSGYKKPIEYLAIGVFLFFMCIGIGTGVREINGSIVFLVGFAVLVVCIIAYALGKRMSLFVESSGGATFGLIFKRSIIEGVTVDEEKVRAVVDIIREMVIMAQAKTTVAPS